MDALAWLRIKLMARAKVARVNGWKARVNMFRFRFISDYVLSENLVVVLSVIWLA